MRSASSPRAPGGAALAACFFASGFAGLVLEVVWSRLLGLHLGGSAEGVTAVVTAYMAGLGAGSLWAARRATRIDRPLRLYAIAETGIAAWAVCSPLVLVAPAPLYRLAHDLEETSELIPFLVRFATSLVLLAVPTFAMGVTLPLLVEARTRAGGGTGPGPGSGDVALLYGINTAGAVAGTLAGGFLLLPLVGMRWSLAAAAAVDLAVAAVAWRLDRPGAAALGARAGDPATAPGVEAQGTDAPDRRADPKAGSSKPARSAGLAEAARTADRGSTAPLSSILRTALLVAFALSGALAMVYELGWTRRLVTLWGSSVYSFSILLATFLAGIAAGSLAARPFARRARGLAPIGLVAGACGVAALGGTALLGAMPGLFRGVLISAGDSPLRILAAEAGLAASVLFLPAFLLGAAFPLVTAAIAGEREADSAAVGRAYAFNTAGTIVGSAGAGLVLLPAFGAERCLRTAAALHVAIGCTLLLLAGGRLARRGVAAGTIALACAGVWFLAPAADPYRMNYGIVSLLRGLAEGAPAPPSTAQLSEGDFHPSRILHVEEGRTATVVVSTSWEARMLTINGKIDASDSDPTQTLVGQLPCLIAGAPREAVVIGFGSGVTTHAVLTHGVERVETVEIEPAVVRAGRFFADINGLDTRDPRRVLLYEDGRVHLSWGRKRYDLIISEPSNPWIAGINNLFTREYFELVRSRLAPGGVFCQWIQTYEMSRETLETLLATEQSVFPGSWVYRQGVDLILVWKESGAHLDRERVAAAFARPAVRDDLARVGFLSAGDLLALSLGPVESLLPAGDRPALNTDDNGRVEFRAPFDLLRRNLPRPLGPPAVTFAGLDRFAPGEEPATLVAFAEGAIRRNEPDRALEAVARLQDADPAAAERLREAASGRIAVIEAGARIDALATQAEAALKAGRIEEASPALEQALALDPRDGAALYRLAAIRFQQGHADEARQLMLRALEAIEEDLPFQRAGGGHLYQGLLLLASIEARAGRDEEALRWLDRARRVNPWQARAEYQAALVLERLGRPREAAEAVQRGLVADPQDGLLLSIAERYGFSRTRVTGP